MSTDAAYSKPTKPYDSDDLEDSDEDSYEGDLVLEQHSGLTFVWGCSGTALRVPHPLITQLLL